MKKLFVLSAIIAGAASAAHAGVSFNIGLGLPHANVVISGPAPIYDASCAPTPVYGQPVYAPEPVYTTPVCPPTVVTTPVYEPVPECPPTVVVERPRVVVHRDVAPRRVVYRNEHFSHGNGNNWGHDNNWNHDRDDHHGRR